MKELLETIVKNLVEFPEQIVIEEKEVDDAVVLELHVSPSDMGKVIGKQGRIAKAIRTVIRSASGKDGKKIMVEIL